jgi:hypothetical protein
MAGWDNEFEADRPRYDHAQGPGEPAEYRPPIEPRPPASDAGRGDTGPPPPGGRHRHPPRRRQGQGQQGQGQQGQGQQGQGQPVASLAPDHLERLEKKISARGKAGHGHRAAHAAVHHKAGAAHPIAAASVATGVFGVAARKPSSVAAASRPGTTSCAADRRS